MDFQKFRVLENQKIDLKELNNMGTGDFKSADDVKDIFDKNIKEISDLQDKLYAEGKTALLIIFQAMDAAGKDSAIKHIMSGVNSQGVNVYSFKQPSPEEQTHDYLWRAVKVLPARGKIAIFNRSYYEVVLVEKVHNYFVLDNVPERCKGNDTIKKRYKSIRNFEEHLWENGIVTVKFFLNLTKEKQAKRFLERIDKKEKNWKFSASDLKERKFWDDYQEAYKTAIEETSTENCPWYVVPADKKWFTRYIISEALVHTLKTIDPQYPTVTAEHEVVLAECKRKLEEE